MAPYAADYLQQENLDATSRTILSVVSVLDDQGAWDWDLYMVGIKTCLFLLIVRITLHKKRGVEWYALIHAIASSLGAAACIYLDWVTSERLTGTPEPQRTVQQCEEPLTSLHRILSSITMGYSLFDFLDGLTISIDFAMHGAATLAVMILFNVMNAPQILAPMMIMETSTIFLNLVKADFLSEEVAILNQLMFVLTFFLGRLVLFPILWVKILVVISWGSSSQDCNPVYFKYIIVGFGVFYNILNTYWFRKIIRKVHRKYISGTEKYNAKNDLADESTDKKKTP